ncbi:MAG: septum formation initiator family protein [Sphingomonadaceae bacterium]
MTREGHRISLPQEQLVQWVALAVLLLLGGLAMAGPSGLLAWSENLQLLDQRQTQISGLQGEIAVLENRVELLDPAHADPDMVGELLRSNFNVVHPDEVVMSLEKPKP